ncbi:high mobility group box domain-containing protein [Thamnocephalis sphaerospora]|uniref:High mobility group box domain-containing protein n=1 Tax=Thamnocephalis sphaerospora TaxID=78915 RepID=A0A4P9XKU6_9FUNG|nr:high mobility group box domain-containing protein [Thamnocephalis sphaerospora]|eukprot:RKP06071.1 high mobility group box domain-containing protein [Thamnocephalis sphaerospora]
MNRIHDPDALKRPPSAFLLFMADRRPLLKKEHPDMSYSDLIKEIGNMWEALSDVQRTEYENRYNEYRAEFQKQQESYQAKKNAGSSTADVRRYYPW